jgi:hypothetical protein
MRSLASDREPTPVAQAAITADFHEPLDVHGNSLAQIAFDHAISLDYVSDPDDLVFRKILNFDGDFHVCLQANLRRPAPADAVYICESDLHPLIDGQIHSRDSSQV